MFRGELFRGELLPREVGLTGSVPMGRVEIWRNFLQRIINFDKNLLLTLVKEIYE